VAVLLIYSCSNRDETSIKNNDKTVGLSHARHFEIRKFDNGFKLHVFNPWQGAEDVVFTYILTNQQPVPEKTGDTTFIFFPVNNVICLSTTHIAFLDAINQTSTITALSGSKYVFNKEVREKIDNNQILDVGFQEQLNYELILTLEPDVVFAYGINSQNMGYYQKIQEMGIPVVFIAEYLEKSPLGKAEWVKFVGTFFDALPAAMKFYSNIQSNYQHLVSLTDSVKNKPVIMAGLPFQGTWYISGANTNLATFINDAGGEYLWEDLTESEVYPMDLEHVFARSDEAELWINPGSANSMKEIVSMDARMVSFHTFASNNIYNNNARQHQAGGNDYFESGVVNPHIILKDLISIFHPELLPEHELIYYKKLE